MNKNDLDITSSKKAVAALKRSIDAYKNFSDKDKHLSDILLAGTIHDFEVAYISCWKSMMSWLVININPDISIGVSYKEVYRIAAKNFLISDTTVWCNFHKTREKTRNIYSKTIAESALKTTIQFVSCANNLLSKLS
jgi:nucleotidyltransferase substrate binding protein (TIGR01987 family)